MTPRLVPLFIVALCAAALVAIAACGGDDDDSSNRPGNLTDPADVPTATAWQDPPEVFIIDPDNIIPIGGEATPVPQETEGADDSDDGDTGEPGVCGETYIVEPEDTMFGIADKCGVDVQDLIDANPDADPSALTIGAELVLP